MKTIRNAAAAGGALAMLAAGAQAAPARAPDTIRELRVAASPSCAIDDYGKLEAPTDGQGGFLPLFGLIFGNIATGLVNKFVGAGIDAFGKAVNPEEKSLVMTARAPEYLYRYYGADLAGTVKYRLPERNLNVEQRRYRSKEQRAADEATLAKELLDKPGWELSRNFTCLVLAYGDFHLTKPDYANSPKPADALAKNWPALARVRAETDQFNARLDESGSRDWPYRKRPEVVLEEAGLPLAGRPLFYLEARFEPSEDAAHSRIRVTPLHAEYNEKINKKFLKGQPQAVVVQFNVADCCEANDLIPAAEQVSLLVFDFGAGASAFPGELSDRVLAAASTGWLPPLPAPAEVKLPADWRQHIADIDQDGADRTGDYLPDGDGRIDVRRDPGAPDYERPSGFAADGVWVARPVMMTARLTETLRPDAFLKAFAEVLAGEKGNIQAAARQLVFPDERRSAELIDDNAKIEACGKLIAVDQKMKELTAEQAKDPPDDIEIRKKLLELQTAQNNAEIALIGVGASRAYCAAITGRT